MKMQAEFKKRMKEIKKDKKKDNKRYSIKTDKLKIETFVSVIVAIVLIFVNIVVFMKIMFPNRGLLYIICNMILSIGKFIQNNWKACIVILLIFVIKHIRSLATREATREATRADNEQMSFYMEQIQSGRSEVSSKISNTKNNLLNAERELQIFKDEVYKVDIKVDSMIEQYENNIKENIKTLNQLEEQFNFEPLDIEKLQKMSISLSIIDNFASNIHTQYIDFKRQMNEENNKKNSSSHYRTENTRENTKETTKDNTRDNTKENTSDMFFAGCNDKDSVTKRYRQLMKTFHPDNQNGDQAMTQNIQYAYEKMIKNMQ